PPQEFPSEHRRETLVEDVQIVLSGVLARRGRASAQGQRPQRPSEPARPFAGVSKHRLTRGRIIEPDSNVRSSKTHEVKRQSAREEREFECDRMHVPCRTKKGWRKSFAEKELCVEYRGRGTNAQRMYRERVPSLWGIFPHDLVRSGG